MKKIHQQLLNLMQYLIHFYNEKQDVNKSFILKI